ncbi:MAG: oligosaccharide flippase family protein, partial [Bacilli bacterium]|nr:oligosaccharide flippase family protein [Bacilli bacterium]
MIKNIFLKSISSLIIYSFLAKVLSVIAKIVIARNISTYAMSIYSLTLPTMSLLISISQLGIPTTISKLIAKKKYPTLKIMQVSVILLMLIDLIVGVIYIFLVPTISSNYLKNDLTSLTLYGIVLLLPLVSLTSLLKGYFIGINKVEKTSICQISEEIARLLFIIVF